MKDLEKKILNRFQNLTKRFETGFEKESLRVSKECISTKPHPRSIGSALTNRYITTDFSEAQLELVTPPFKNSMQAHDFLDNIHHFVSHEIDQDILWPFSMPPDIQSQEAIPIAKYGESNLAKFKELYRKGLASRYGKVMQAISGFHFNYSISKNFWSKGFERELDVDIDFKDFRSKLYFNLIRNISRNNWLIIYLFGASPIVAKGFLDDSQMEFDISSDGSFYLPYATSLRMSRFGYQNKKRKNLKVSLNNITDYISDLKKATSTPYPEFSDIDVNSKGSMQQLNDNILQIDDEYYAVVRAKSEIPTDERLSLKLQRGGVDFVEYRSLDLNPFSKVGIDENAIYFLEVLLTDCFIRQKGNIDSDEIKSIEYNDEIVAIKGRRKDLKIISKNKKIKLAEHGNMIIDKLLPIASLLDDEESRHSKSLEHAKHLIFNPEETPSARILDEIITKRISMMELGERLGKENKDYYLQKDKSLNQHWDLLEKEAKISFDKQFAIESNNATSFETYLSQYFK